MAPKRARKSQSGKGLSEVLSKIKDVVVQNKLISKGLSAIPHPAAQGASWVAAQLGLGRKRKSPKRVAAGRLAAARRTGSLLVAARRAMPKKTSLDVLTHPAGFVVGSSLKAPRSIAGKGFSTKSPLVLSLNGSQQGRGIFSDLGGGIGSIFGGLGGGIGSIAHGLFGGGRNPL